MAFSRTLEHESPSLVFTVHRKQPELVAPCKATPHEIKILSDIDSQAGLRAQIPIIQFYCSEPSMEGKDPVEIIRNAIAQALVFYYPLAGRLRERPDGKLMVDCNEEGVMFIEADADVTLDQFGDALEPPFPCFEELLYDVPGSEGVIDTPLLLIQVTRLKCGGFIFGLRFNHAMIDGVGIVTFMYTLSAFSHGAQDPPFTPIWRRELLTARDPPRVTCPHPEYDQLTDPNVTTLPADLQQHSFFFGDSEVSTLRSLLPESLSSATTFQILTAFVWQCRTKALRFNPNDDVRMMCITDGRAKFNPPIPNSYYGNCLVLPAAVTTAGKLTEGTLGYPVGLIKEAIEKVDEEYIHSVADFMVTNGRPLFTTVRSCIVLDTTYAGFRGVDFGWGKALYGGLAKPGAGAFPAVNFHVPSQNEKGEEGILVLTCLPTQALKAFAKVMDEVLESNQTN
ncbi:hypothetical protein AAHE18_U067200 [Arachis hypogaea]